MIDPDLGRVLNGDHPVICIRLKDVKGSSPREVGTEMFVTSSQAAGTIGGGQLEYLSMKAARKLLVSQERQSELTIPLGPEIGQCCGGRVIVTLSKMTNAERKTMLNKIEEKTKTQPHIYVLGSGHVGRALANFLQHLPFRTILVDQRDVELARCDADIEKRVSALPEAEIDAATPGSAFVITTHDHGLDFLLTAAALRRGDAAYVGLIGSATKRAKFERWLRENDDTLKSDALICPIGASDIRDKRPEIIASLVVSEIVVALSAQRGF